MEQPVLAASVQQAPASLKLCPLCDKPFTLEYSFKRHISYCRRTQTKRKARPRSCVPCNTSKTKCSFGRPQCSRCEERGFDCVYDQPRNCPPAAVPPDPSKPGWVTNPSPGYAVGTVDLPLAFDFTINTDHEDLDYFTSPSKRSGDTNKAASSIDAPWNPTLDPSISDDISFLANNIPAQPDASTALIHLRHGNPALKHAASLITNIICAFPQMMLRRQTFPPFIHPHWHLPSLPERLSTCMSIAQLFVARTPETRPFLWRMIDTEERRFRDEVNDMSVHEILQAIQAIMVFIIMGIIDQDNDPLPRGETLVRTFQILCTRFRNLIGSEFFSESEYTEPSNTWEKWILAESRRRVTCLWFVISRVVSTQADIPCARFFGYDFLPLISSKMVWEARTAEEWRAEKVFHDAGNPMVMFGELNKARKGSGELVTTRLAAWEAGADKMGLLMTIATALV